MIFLKARYSQAMITIIVFDRYNFVFDKVELESF